jgi:hypothetical protein
MAIVVVLVTNLIYFSEEIKKCPFKKTAGGGKCSAKTPYKGITRGN